MMAYGIQARAMAPAVSGLASAGAGVEASRAAASAACGSSPAGFGSVGAAGDGDGGLSKCHSFFGLQKRRKIAVSTSEKMPPPMSVIGHNGTPKIGMVAKTYWKTANEPPATSRAGHT